MGDRFSHRLGRGGRYGAGASNMGSLGQLPHDDFTRELWLLKLGAPINLYLLADTFAPPATAADARILIPARIFFAVSAYRCMFPVRYEHNVVFHDTPWSSIFLTRLFATFSEVTYIYQFAYVLRLFNLAHVGWVDALSWAMVLQVAISQFLVWAAILTERFELYFYEELGWALIFVINTLVSGYLAATVDGLGEAKVLLYFSLLFGAVYLPWQILHLRALRLQAFQAERSRVAGVAAGERDSPSRATLREGMERSLRVRNRRRDAGSWGGLVGLTWMAGYWATLLPLWISKVVAVLSRLAV